MIVKRYFREGQFKKTGQILLYLLHSHHSRVIFILLFHAMRKLFYFGLGTIGLLLSGCGVSDVFVAAPVPYVGTVVVASTPAQTAYGSANAVGTAVVVTPQTVGLYPYGYRYYSPRYVYTPVYKRRLPPPPPPRKRYYRR